MLEVETIAWPAHRTVAAIPGSLPMGGVVPMTPIHAFTEPAAALAFRPYENVHRERRDIVLDDILAFAINDVVRPEEADAIVDATERFGYRDEAPGISTPPGMRMNKSVHWVADAAFTNAIFQRVAPHLPPSIAGAPLHGDLSQRINMYRYDANDVFNRHTDGDWPGYSLSADRMAMEEWHPRLRSALTMLLYLNGLADGVVGGNTRLFSRAGRAVDVAPVKGSALFFRHGFDSDSVLHEGCRVTGGVAKYVARINVMYQRS
jgi:2OG-Fe(II) oxygenase superfamily